MTTTDPQYELLTQVDKQNKVIGPIKRGVAHNTPGIFYRTIYILVKNLKNEFLIQKRSSTKDLFPNCWDISVGGHVDFGDSYLETAARELQEELGITSKEVDLKFKGKVLVKLPKSNEYFYVYEYILKPNQKIITEKNEIRDTTWMTIENIKKTMADKSLLWYTRPEQIISALY